MDPRTLILPGLIDCHVHFREPGFEQKGTMATEAKSAIFGGVTTVCDMPNTNPPTVTYDVFADKVRRAKKIKKCDIRFFFGITNESHLTELQKVCADASLNSKLCGVKLYLDHSTGDQKVDGGIVQDVFRTCAELGLTLVAHCEDSEMNALAASKNISKDVSAHSEMRPPESEAKSIAFAIDLAERFGTKFHVAHLSTREGLDLVRNAKSRKLSVTCEVTPHHLFLTTDDYKRLETFGKMNPPLRSKEHQDALWDGIHDGTVDCISTDHAPHTKEEKETGSPLSAPSGVPGVETMLPLLLTAASEGKLRYEDIPQLCYENPNRIFSLGKPPAHRSETTITINLDKEWTIDATKLHSLCGWTPFDGWKMKGKITRG